VVWEVYQPTMAALEAGETTPMAVGSLAPPVRVKEKVVAKMAAEASLAVVDAGALPEKADKNIKTPVGAQKAVKVSQWQWLLGRPMVEIARK
jgi:hypothetical protein